MEEGTDSRNHLPVSVGKAGLPTLDEQRRQAKERFLKAFFESSGNVSKACRAALISRQTAYNYRTDDPEFAAEWDHAQEAIIDAAEQELYRRGVLGYQDAVVYQGEVTGSVTRYDTTALIFLLKGKRPEVWRDNRENAEYHRAPVEDPATNRAAVQADMLAAVLDRLRQERAGVLAPPAVDVESVDVEEEDEEEEE